MKKRSYISLIFLYFFVCSAWANDHIPFEQLTFTSELERNSFHSTLNNSTSYIQMLCTVNPSINQKEITDITKKLNEIYRHLEEKNIRKKQPFKAARLVHRTLHQKLFKDFKKYTYFDEVFSNGNYNCATATAILALTFEHFKIPYSIQEQRKHVFIIVKDEQNDIIVESTDEKNGVYLMNKKTIVEEWTNLELIQLRQNSFIDYDSLFKVYTKTDFYSIDFKELTANLYTNAAILMQKNELHQAAEQMMVKSLYLYNNREEKFRDAVNINYLILNVDIYQPQSLNPLLDLIKKEQTSTMAQNELIGFFEYATKYLLLEKKDFYTHQKLSFYILDYLNANEYSALLERINYVNAYYK